MSEFRLFCVGGFVWSGIFSALANHHIGKIEPGSVYEQLLCMAVLGGCIAVSVFGRRKPS